MEWTLVEIEPGARVPWVPLLELADEPGPLHRDLEHGRLFGVTAGGTARPIGAVLAVPRDDETVELRAVAVDAGAQGKGVGTWMVRAVCHRLRAGHQRLVVGTASSGTRQLAFYQRLGFRLTGVERDYFTAARGYPAGLEENGIPTRDMVWMELER